MSADSATHKKAQGIPPEVLDSPAYLAPAHSRCNSSRGARALPTVMGDAA